MKLIEYFKETILENISKDANNYVDLSETSYSGTVELIYDRQIVCEVKFSIDIICNIPYFLGDYDTPPHNGDYEFILSEVKITPVYNQNNVILNNVTSALQSALNNKIGDEII